MKIVHQTDWMLLRDIPSAGSSSPQVGDVCISKWKKILSNKASVLLDRSGVYQVSLTKPDDLVHKNICYIGFGSDLAVRVNSLRLSAQKTAKSQHHDCGVFIRHSDKLSVDNVYVRCLFTNGVKAARDLEADLQKQHRIKYNYTQGFKWSEASGGHKASRIRIISAITRLTDIDICKELKLCLDERIKQLKAIK